MSNTEINEDTFFEYKNDEWRFARGMTLANNGKYYDISRVDWLRSDGTFFPYKNGEGKLVATSREVKDDCKDPAHAYDWTLRELRQVDANTSDFDEFDRIKKTNFLYELARSIDPDFVD